MEREVKGRSWMPVGIAFAILLTILFSVYVVDLFGTIDQQRQQLNLLQGEKDTLATLLGRKEAYLRVISGRTVHMATLRGSRNGPGAFGKFIWDSGTGDALLQISHLLPTPQNKKYQLWIWQGPHRVHAATFIVSDSLTHFIDVDSPVVADSHAITSIAITLEDAVGVHQPTGDVYLSGTSGKN